MTKAILDSNFLIALIDEKDKWRKTAISIQKVLKKKKARLVYLSRIDSSCPLNKVCLTDSRK